jgi:hypothetical protein
MFRVIFGGLFWLAFSRRRVDAFIQRYWYDEGCRS